MATMIEYKKSIETNAAELFRRVKDADYLDEDNLKFLDARLGDLIDLINELDPATPL